MQRDVGLHVPINFHTVPAVSLKQACFIDNQYEHQAFQKCFSNLLGVGFTRFTVDVYWDPLRTDWSLCPVQLPQLNTRDVIAVPEVPQGADLEFERRQDATQTGSNSAVSSSSLSPSLSSSLSLSSKNSTPTPTVTSYPISNNPPLIQVGNYNCTSLTNLGLLTGILADFLDNTATTVGAALSVLTLNVHAAASALDPDGPAPQLPQNQMPVSGMLLSDVMRGNLSQELYTPSSLEEQRANLNRSWYNGDLDSLPYRGYYNLSTLSGHSSTENGWPTEYFVEFQELYRIVVGFDSIDPQMQNYNTGPDSNYIFPAGSLTRSINTTIRTNGKLTSGCLFDASDMSIDSSTNSSWAISTAPQLNLNSTPNLDAPLSPLANLTSCGLTAYLNESLANTTADKNPLPYAAYVHSLLWTWAPGEPLNASSNPANTTGNRCVVMGTSTYAGRWRVADCKERHRVACHNPSQPYNWQISSADSDYSGASTMCHAPFQFSVPHTALENAHLLAALQAHQQTSPNDDAIFVDLNALDVPDCWVVGLNGTCPYLKSSDGSHTRIVVVPTIAAVIIFVLAVLTFFVKCAANRRENQRGRRRRILGGWEYEGVPS